MKLFWIGGSHPRHLFYINTIATFLTRRCYEQVVLDCCLHRTRVRLIGSEGIWVLVELPDPPSAFAGTARSWIDWSPSWGRPMPWRRSKVSQ